MDPVTYNIPLDLIPEYRDRQVVLRCIDPADLVRLSEEQDFENVRYVQLLSADIEPEAIGLISNWDKQVPLDIVLDDPGRQFPLLHNFSRLIDKHAVRVTIPAKPGCLKAMKLALDLNLAVKLDPGQPDAAMIAEMAEALDLYLHRPSVGQPVEYFHSLFLSSYSQKPDSLWVIQEEDPESFCFVTDDGVRTVSQRLVDADRPGRAAGGDASDYPSDGLSSIDCDTCEFLTTCRGYFKWPDSSYNCAGVKSIFRTIAGAAAQLTEDVAAAAAIQGGEPPR